MRDCRVKTCHMTPWNGIDIWQKLCRHFLIIPTRVGPDIRLFSIPGRIPDIETIQIPDIRLSAGYPAFARYPAQPYFIHYSNRMFNCLSVCTEGSR